MLLYPILGILGGLLCATGDLLLDLKGKDNRMIDANKMISSNWISMKRWRFLVSIILALFGVPLIMLGGISLAEQISNSNESLGNMFYLSVLIGSMGGFFIHTILCIVPILFQELRKITDEEKSCYIILVIWKAVCIPFLSLYLILILLGSILLITAIIKGYLFVPLWCVCLNPLCFSVIGVLLRKIFPKYCYELPGICMPSLGLSMFGVITLIHLL
ncbi:MAG: DUF6796 family protein [Bacillota bacterium]